MSCYTLTRLNEEVKDLVAGCINVLMHNGTEEERHENVSTILIAFELRLSLVQAQTELAAIDAEEPNNKITFLNKAHEISKLRTRLFSFLHTIDLEMVSKLKKEGERNVSDN